MVLEDVLPCIKYINRQWKVSCDSGESWNDVSGGYCYNWQVPIKTTETTSDSDEYDMFLFFSLADWMGFQLAVQEIKLSSTDLAFKTSGESRTITYTTIGKNSVFDVCAPSGWQVSIVPESSTSGTITITAPGGIEESVITITATSDIGSAESKIKCGRPKFSFSKSECAIGHDGGNISVAVKTNVAFSVKIPDDAQSWIELVTEETADEKIVLRVSKNEEAYARNATILCLGEDGVVLDKFSVSQSWDENKIFEIRVPGAGTLQEYMKAHNMLDIKKLKVSGPLNDDDLLFLCSMRSLKYIDVSDVDAQSIPNGCFKNSGYCETFVLPKALTAIPEKSFYGCKSIKEIFIPASCETIGVSAFEYCSSLSSVSFESGSCLKTISSSAFASCRALKTITIPASCNTIGDNAFSSCASLTDFSCAGESALTSVGSGAFKYCDNLHRIDMHNCTKLKSIGSRAFYGDNQIYSFQIETVVPPSCQTDTFGNVGEYSVLKVPSGSEDAYRVAPGWGDFYKIIANE